MAFINSNGKRISYKCGELIEELKQDILKYGGETTVYVWCKEMNGVEVYVNYDLINKEEPLDKLEIEEGETVKYIAMFTLLDLLE